MITSSLRRRTNPLLEIVGGGLEASLWCNNQVKNDNRKARFAYRVILVACPTVQTVEALGVKTGGSKTSRGAAETQRPPTTRRKKAWTTDMGFMIANSWWIQVVKTRIEKYRRECWKPRRIRGALYSWNIDTRWAELSDEGGLFELCCRYLTSRWQTLSRSYQLCETSTFCEWDNGQQALDEDRSTRIWQRIEMSNLEAVIRRRIEKELSVITDSSFLRN